MEGHLKCFDAQMNPVHDVTLDEVEDGLHQGCGNIVFLWADADPALAQPACHQHGVCYTFTVSESPEGRRYLPTHQSVR